MDKITNLTDYQFLNFLRDVGLIAKDETPKRTRRYYTAEVERLLKTDKFLKQFNRTSLNAIEESYKLNLTQLASEVRSSKDSIHEEPSLSRFSTSTPTRSFSQHLPPPPRPAKSMKKIAIISLIVLLVAAAGGLFIARRTGRLSIASSVYRVDI